MGRSPVIESKFFEQNNIKKIYTFCMKCCQIIGNTSEGFVLNLSSRKCSQNFFKGSAVASPFPKKDSSKTIFRIPKCIVLFSA